MKRVHIDMVMEEDIAEVIAGWTGIPMTKISETESKKLLNMEETLHERLIGQHQAIVSVSKAIRRARVGLRNPNRPIASFIFAGPTGVGKTELTKALASYFFGSEEAIMSDGEMVKNLMIVLCFRVNKLYIVTIFHYKN